LFIASTAIICDLLCYFPELAARFERNRTYQFVRCVAFEDTTGRIFLENTVLTTEKERAYIMLLLVGEITGSATD